MKVLKILGIAILTLVALIIVVGLVAPKDYHVERTINISASKEQVFNHVKYWRNWQAWSPWAAQDSLMRVTVEGTDGEVGSKYIWVGDPELTGKGEMTNTGIKTYEEIAYHLHFLEPWESESDGYVRLIEVDEGVTQVAWGFQGEMPFPWNIFMLFMSMESMIGNDFDRGLGLLKNIIEQEKAAIESYKIQKIIFPAKNYAGIRDMVAFSGMQSFFQNSFSTLQQEIKKKNLRIIGAPAGIYFSWDEQNMNTDMAAAFPIRGSLSGGSVQMVHVPAQTAYLIDYFGDYESLGYAHQALDLYLTGNGLRQKSPVIEEYITDPISEPDTSKWLTKIYYFAE